MKLPGVKDVSVNLLKNSMMVSYDEAQLSTAGIVEAVEKTGYGAIPKDAPQRKAEAKAEISTAQAEYKAIKQQAKIPEGHRPAPWPPDAGPGQSTGRQCGRAGICGGGAGRYRGCPASAVGFPLPLRPSGPDPHR